MHTFVGKWITDYEFFQLEPRNVFHRQLQKVKLSCESHRNRHILFRREFFITDHKKPSTIYISADDYYKLYINGQFVGQGPAPSYHFAYNYNEIDVTSFLRPGKNIIAVHTLYQGLINRVWQSGDQRHGLIFDLLSDGEVVICSDTSVKTAVHSAYREIGTVGYKTQFLEEYDSRSTHVGFERIDYEDSDWDYAQISQYDDHILTKQESHMLTFESIQPVAMEQYSDCYRFDFGSAYVGYLDLTVEGCSGDTVTIRCGQELDPDGTLRYHLRANCCYEESWILRDGKNRLDWFDYKSFRYVEILLPEECKILNCVLIARHYPFALKAQLAPEYTNDLRLRKVWELCVHTQKYGVQEVIQDCMEREKGFYLGDGCYTALTNMLLTHDDSMVRKLIDDAFSTTFITPGLVTCLDCSYMQEIAEYPFMLVYLCLWHYRFTGDIQYLRTNYPKITALLESYRESYEENNLLSNLDKWCVVEWPKNFQDGYDVEITEGIICTQPHVSLNAYYIEAVKTANKIANILDIDIYRDETPLRQAFMNAFYCKDKLLFKDGVDTDHISIVGNMFPFAFGLCPDKACEEKIVALLSERKISSLSLFCSFLALWGLHRCGRSEMVKEMLLDENAWLRIIREDSKTTFEGWGKDTKWNTSLFHLTLSYAAAFMTDFNASALFN
jgi:hypothetical protein